MKPSDDDPRAAPRRVPKYTRRAFLAGSEAPRRLSTPAAWAYLKVSEGCSHACAFCAIPAIKGPYRSRSAASIVREAEGLVARGVREIILVSQDTTFFGRDRGRRGGLAALLRRLGRIEGLAWIRFLYGYPEEIDDDLLEAMAGPKVCRYLDIPFQHADPKIVKAMGRSFPAERALRTIERIRRRLPGVSLRTSLIVGFPGEGRREFDGLLAFVREAAFDHLGVFTYSREEGTAAWSLGDPVPAPVKQRRLERILKLQAGLSAGALAAQVGRRVEAMIEGAWASGPSFLVGRTRAQAPEVDGVVLVERPAGWSPDRHPLVEVEITAADVYDLHGRIASPRPTR
jgi:ribosomal protein S12 methylthiotransferase